MRLLRCVGAWSVRLCGAGLPLCILTTAAVASELGGPAKRVTMDFAAIEIGRVLAIIEEVSGLNIVVGSEVRGRITVRLHDVPWPQALESILRANGYDYVRQGNVIRVDKAETLRKERDARRPRRECASPSRFHRRPGHALETVGGVGPRIARHPASGQSSPDRSSLTGVVAMAEKRDIRFCPYCSLMEFDMATAGTIVHCEMCGIDVPADELIESI
ncbi:MAG TPA: secretin and TonB N-terminal domain-containing protein [Candidatus Methylomirabilis sp.]|nr:secretin and TonB N-terminal domain-containing protein [Candidatus Methylomirabilis sp.]